MQHLFLSPSFFTIIKKKWAPSWCKRHRLRHNRTPPHKPMFFIVFLVFFLSFCSLLFYINCVFYSKLEPENGFHIPYTPIPQATKPPAAQAKLHRAFVWLMATTRFYAYMYCCEENFCGLQKKKTQKFRNRRNFVPS